MYLPNAYRSAEAAISASTQDGSKGSRDGWSSLIGVITAICGNILISFALNTQRYAHMRLSRDREQRLQEKRKAAKRRHASYGTQQEQIAEERARKNAKGEESNGYPEQSGETEPLMGREDSRKGSGAGSDNTARPEDKDDEEKEKSYLKSPIWWLGITLMVLGEIGNFLAYGFAPASIVSPLGVVALVSNCIIAPLLLGEQFRWRDGLGVIIAIGGCVTVVLSASASNPKLTPDAIWELVTTWEFETYLGITLFLIVVLLVLSNKYGHKTILIDLGLVGLFGGYTALSTKGVASLLTYKIWRVVTFPITYLLLAVLIFTAVMQIKYVNRALQRFNATMVIPTQFVLFTLSVIIGSAVLYRDFEREAPGDAAKFVSGCALTFFGVWCITSGRKQESSQDDEDEDEDAINLVDEEGAMTEVRDGDDAAAVRQSSFATTASKDSPSLRRYQSELTDSTSRTSLARSPPQPEANPLSEQIPDIAPGTASAIHTSTASQLHSQANVDPPKKPAIHATTSEPVVPTTPNISALRPKTPLMRTPSGPPTDTPSPDRRHLDSNTIGPSPKLLSRHSVSLLPGPLTSPLSGSLSAIVADELRRGIDKSPAGALRARRKTPTPSSTLRPTNIQSNAAIGSSSLKRHSIASGEMDFDSEEAAELRAAAGSPREGGVTGRGRSLSATLSDMFSSGSGSAKRQRTALGGTAQRNLEAAFEEDTAKRRGEER
ncbi:hypothetical protein M409DRAFT_19000 [Zasmidium cellare ATCC 36951]|uniref:DUF803-domain-containing protein n=1 Tax=Zasmidium cellare ATCC 36951 TaxID=1080233 RepID=A0A6A6CV23_ZASCE|nr:uncharacterized protein M409DRAFT_19000 [Zasmidium cellare ATCC 36951]KAF2171027.1 hypothetical protein M409DRAFT_19000 [Zasmidium cellare ATCC 36951]